jgi:hypothetical protein
LVTNRLTYTVSAKPKALIIAKGGGMNLPIMQHRPPADRRSFEGQVGLSVESRGHFPHDGRSHRLSPSRLEEAFGEKRRNRHV